MPSIFKVSVVVFFIEHGVIDANVVDDNDNLICYDEQPFDPGNPQHQSLARLLDTVGAAGNPHRLDRNPSSVGERQ